MMGATLPRPKLALLIPRLASEHEGEIVATVRAIGRTLQSSGADFHDLAQAVEHVPAPIVIYRDRDGAGLEGGPTWAGSEHSERLAWLDIIAHADWATDWESNFAADIRVRLRAAPYRPLSPKQRATLDRLIARAVAKGERP